MSILNEIAASLQTGKRKEVIAKVQQALDEKADAAEILNQGLLAGMDEVGKKFKANEIFVPQVLVSARAMNAGVEILKPFLSEEAAAKRGKICMGTVEGDLHDIGKNLVIMMFEGKGFDVIDLGVDVPAEKFVQTAMEQNCDIIGCSALLTTTMPNMEKVVKEAEKQGIREKVKIMVGGSPVTEEFAKKIGADIYTEDAATAAEAAVQLVSM